tara:strand:- start:636 stop:1328 length:693 start_codon:yes stop_codon:yes gene_type:complete
MNFFYHDFFFTLLLCFGVNFILNLSNIKEHFFGPIGVNLVRSIICGSLANNAYKNYYLAINDKCIVIDSNLELFKNYHHAFFNYFVIDLLIMFYQKYNKIVEYIRLDLLFHHLLAIHVLLIIEYTEMYSLSLLIGLSEGMSLVSGFKLLSNYFNNKYLTNIFIYYRLFYCIFIRMFFLWPSLFFLYNDMTNNCEKFKDNRNITMILGFISIILITESKWIYKGKKELMKI